jgi:hypothetical protein
VARSETNDFGRQAATALNRRVFNELWRRGSGFSEFSQRSEKLTEFSKDFLEAGE